MNISEALCAAADHIEQHPEKYDFRESYIPPPGFCACMLGRLGLIAGVRYGTNVDDIARRILGKSGEEFYKQVFELIPERQRSMLTLNRVDLEDAKKVAPAMRTIAQEYKGIPDDVLALFAKGEVVPA